MPPEQLKLPFNKVTYVAGFLIDDGKVALVRKNRPTWQKGKLNGIGGHVEPGETPIEAMRREFYEETGVKVYGWTEYASLSGDDFTVTFFYAFGDTSQLRTVTDEEIVILPINEVSVYNAIPNLTWLIPMASAMGFDRASEYTIREVA